MIDAIEILGLILAAALAALTFYYARWESWDDRRRSDRLVHRNLNRMAGR